MSIFSPSEVSRGLTVPMSCTLEYMHCPFCHNADTKVLDSRADEDGVAIRRRRECMKCHRRFTTMESCELTVVKRDGHTERFDRNKVIVGVGKACQSRPITQDQLKELGRKVEEELRASGQAQIPSVEVGKAILKPLRDLDLVAYMRFASVYRDFKDLSDFEAAIEELRQYEKDKNTTLTAGADTATADASDPAAAGKETGKEPGKELGKEAA